MNPLQGRLIVGKAFYCGDHVNTDVMSPGRFEPYENPSHLARCALIDYESEPPVVDPATGRSIYKVIVAGHDFGCGSSRETAPQALHYAGADAIIARSFARIFFRNCINLGLLLPIECDHSFDASILGQTVEIDCGQHCFRVAGQEFAFKDFGPLNPILAAGGLIPYTRQRLARQALSTPAAPEHPQAAPGC